MKVFLFIFATLFINSECFLGDSYYTGLINQWKFAYNIISDTTIDFTAISETSELQNSIAGGTNASSKPETVFLNDLDINWSNIPNSAFVVPLVSYPIAIIYNSPLLNEPLKLTRELLYRILTTLVTWNDPELVALNPGLATVSASVRVTLNQEPSTVNQYIIDYIFQDVNISSDQVEYGSWIGLVALHHRLSTDYSKVLFSVTATANAMAFIPWPLTTSSVLTPAQLVSTDNTTITIDDVSPPTINRIQSGQTQITLERSEDTWPMNVIGYLLFDQDKIDCSSIQENVRFFYWSCNNTNLINTTLIEGFKMVNPNATDDLMESNCSGNRILQYENLSKASRSEFLLGFSITLVMIFIGMIFFRFYQARKNMTMQEKRKYRFRSAFHSGIIIFGLILFLVGAIIWYFPASDDWICVSRMVFSGLGICFVISSAFMYAFAFARNIRGQGKEEKLQVRVVFVTCLLVSILEGLLLLFWMIFDQPQATEIVQDAIDWKSRYVCQSDSNIPEIIQYVYFCIIIIYGCVEVNHYWKEKGILDPRLILGSLYSELLIFIILIVMSTLIEFTDENLYIVKVSLYLMAIGNISGAWFMQSFIRWISELKKNSSGSKNDQSQMHTMNTVSSINATVLETAESRRSSSAADLPE